MPGGLGGFGASPGYVGQPRFATTSGGSRGGYGTGAFGAGQYTGAFGAPPNVQVDPAGRAWEWRQEDGKGTWGRVKSLPEELWAGYGGAGGGGFGGGTPLPREGGPTPTELQLSPIYGKVSDAQGRIAAKALEALKDVYTSRGLTGSGLEAAGSREILGELMRNKSQSLWDAAIKQNEREWEGEKLTHEGAITQRGQDTDLMKARIAALQSLWSSYFGSAKSMTPTYNYMGAPPAGGGGVSYGGGGGLGAGLAY